MYVFISALKWHCQAQDIRIPTQQSLLLSLGVKLHYHGVPLEGERKRERGWSQKRLIITNTHSTGDAHLPTVLK